MDYLNPNDGAMSVVSLDDSAGTIRLLNVINSIDTPVCHIETHHWDSSAPIFRWRTVYTISMDLPFAQARWHNVESVTHQSLSAHKSEHSAWTTACCSRNGGCCSERCS